VSQTQHCGLDIFGCSPEADWTYQLHPLHRPRQPGAAWTISDGATISAAPAAWTIFGGAIISVAPGAWTIFGGTIISTAPAAWIIFGGVTISAVPAASTILIDYFGCVCHATCLHIGLAAVKFSVPLPFATPDAQGGAICSRLLDGLNFFGSRYILLINDLI
jgi:hypothetical protein